MNKRAELGKTSIKSDPKGSISRFFFSLYTRGYFYMWTGEVSDRDVSVKWCTP